MEILTLIQSMISIMSNKEYIPSFVKYDIWNILYTSLIKHLHNSQIITTFATIFNK